MAGDSDPHAELAARLREVEQMKTDFIELISHELRTPLVALMSGTELLERLDGELGAPERAELIGAIRRQGERLFQLIANLLDLSRLEQGHLRMSVGMVALGPVVDEVIRNTPPLPGLDIRVDIADDVTVRADDLYLRRIVQNLLVNAADYGAEPIEVSANRKGADVQLRIRDHGDGVPHELAPTVFEKFTRGTRDGATPGSGLGLALVAALADGFGGTVHLEPGETKGSTFVVTLQGPREDQT